MKFLGILIGSILTGIGHIFAFLLKNAYISIRRFTMDPVNKNTIWNMQAIIFLIIFLFSFVWLVGEYQDQYYIRSGPVLYRAIPLLLSCFLGHLIYSCPLFFKNQYSKPLIQTFLNCLTVLAAGQIIMKFTSVSIGLLLTCILIVVSIGLTLHYTLNVGVKSTIFNRLTKVAEQVQRQPRIDGQIGEAQGLKDINDISSIDLSKPGCLSSFRYNSEEVKLQLFHTEPTKERQSQLMELNRSDRAQHSQIIAGTGAGKTLLSTNLTAQDLLNDFIGTTVLEPKGSYIKRLSYFMDRIGRPYRRLDPDYELTDCLNPFYVPGGEDIEPMIEANVSAFHGYLGPDAEQFFKSRATNLLRVGIKALKMAYGNECTYNDLDRLIQPINDEYRAELLAKLKDKTQQTPLLLEYTRNMANPKMMENTMKTYSNLYDYLTELTSNKYIQKIFCGASTFNIDDALKNGEVVLVNGAYGKLQTLTFTVGRLFLNLFRASTFRRSLSGRVRPHQITVDEIELFADEEFSTFLEMSREFETFVTVIHQNNEQLVDVSRRLAANVRQNAVQKFVMAGLDPVDAKFYADLIGEEYKVGTSSGTDEMSTTGFKTQIKEEKRYAVLPADILKLKGYNKETGEPAECLFRGVHSNVRLEPVKGLIYPLPMQLFTPLGEEANAKEHWDKEDDTQITIGPVSEEEQTQSHEHSEEGRRQKERLEKLKVIKDSVNIQVQMLDEGENQEQEIENDVKAPAVVGDRNEEYKEIDKTKLTIKNELWEGGKVVSIDTNKVVPLNSGNPAEKPKSFANPDTSSAYALQQRRTASVNATVEAIKKSLSKDANEAREQKKSTQAGN